MEHGLSVGHIIVLQLFWLSIPFIGLVVRSSTRRWRLKKPLAKPLDDTLSDRNALVDFLLVTAFGFAAFVPLTVACYALSLPVTVLEVVYLLTLAFSATYHVAHWRNYLLRLQAMRLRPNISWVWAVVIVGFLGFDAFVTLQTGAPLYYDAPLQVSKVNLFIGGHLSLADPYFGYHGVMDPRYSANLMDALQAVAARLCRVNAVAVWYYSGAFFRFLFSLGLFALAWTFLDWTVRRLAYAILPLTAFLYPLFFLYAELPDRLALVWTALLLVGLKVWAERRQSSLLVVACLLLACTHAANAAIALAFLALLGAASFVMRAVDKRQLIGLGIAGAVLVPPVLLQLAYPNHIRSDPRYFNAEPLSGPKLVFHHYGAIRLLPVHVPFSLSTALMFAATLALASILEYLRMRWLRIFAYLGVLVGVVVSYNPALMGLFGWLFIYHYTDRRSFRVVLLLLLVFFGLLVYDPVFLQVAAHRVPPWLISRSNEFNMLAMVTPVIGVLVLCTRGPRAWAYHRLSVLSAVAVVPLMLLTLSVHHVISVHDVAFQSANNVDNALWNEENLQPLLSLQPQLTGQTVFMTGIPIPLALPTVVQANTVSMGPKKVNGSPMSNTVRRDACSSAIQATMRLANLQAAGVTRVVVATTQPTSSIERLVSSKPYLSLRLQTPGYAVYAVERNPSLRVDPATACALPYGQ